MATLDTKDFEQPLMRIIKYYTGDVEFNINDLRKAHSEIVAIAQKRNLPVPNDVYSMIAATYISKAKKIEGVSKINEYYNSALDIYQELLKSISVEKDPSIYSDTQKKIGGIYWELSNYLNKQENSRKSIKAYSEALKVYTPEGTPIDYAMTQNNLGTAYNRLAEVEDKAQNCKSANEEALKVYTPEDFPMQYAMTKASLGKAYGTLAEVEDKAQNCKRALNAYEEALKVFTKEEFPESYQLVEQNLKKLIEFCKGK